MDTAPHDAEKCDLCKDFPGLGICEAMRAGAESIEIRDDVKTVKYPETK